MDTPDDRHDDVRNTDALEAMFRYAPGGIFTYSAEADEQFAFVSANMLAFLGYTREEFARSCDNRFSLMIVPEDREATLATIREQISHGPFDTCEYRIRKRDGSIAWVHDEGHIVTDEHGKRWFYVVIVDITDSMEERQRLASRNSELERVVVEQQRMIDRIPGGIRIFRKIGDEIVCVNANQYFADMLGLRKEDLIGETFEKVEARIHPDDVASHREETVRNLELRRHSEGTYRFRDGKTGEYRWFHLDARLEAQPDGSDLAYFHYTDVDDLMRAEERLQRSQEQYELAVKGAHLAVWDYDIATRRLTVPAGENSAFARERYGLTGNVVEDVPDSMLPMGLTDEDRAQFIRLYDEVRSGNEYATADVWFRSPGREAPCCDRLTYYVVKDAAGVPVHGYGVGYDVTAQKQESLRYHQTLQSILATNPDALCMFQLNLTRDVCQKGHGIAPYILHSLQSATATGLFENCLAVIPYPDDRRRFSAVFSRDALLESFEDGNLSQHVDYRRKGEDGTPFWVRTFVNLLKNPETSEIEGIIYSLDISRERRRDDIFAILTGEEYDFVALMDLNQGTIEAIHLSEQLPKEYARSFAGVGSVCSFSEMRENGAGSWVAEEDRQRYVEGTSPETIRARLDESGSYDLVVKGHLEGRGTVYRKLQHYYLNDERRFVLIIDSDVTQTYLERQREIERAKEETRIVQGALDAAERANRAKSDFLSRMSHDMRTPLNGIIGMTYLTEEMDLSPEARENLRKIDISSKFLLGLINDILDMTKAESGETELHLEPYAPEDFYEYIDAVIRPLCTEKCQTFSMSANPPEDVVPLFDKLRINQVVFNLLSNAVKYTPEGGSISYDAHFGECDDDGRIPVRITVSDNGIGMGEEFQKSLFEPFAREERSEAAEAQGTGLGLSIAKHLVELMGGTIAVRSVVGGGTTFTIDLQVMTVPRSSLVRDDPAAETVGDTRRLRGRHVLLCEDHPLNQEIARTLLEQQGVIVEVADNGELGVEAFANSPVGFFDAVLMDIRMPVMDGYAATRGIRALARSDAPTVPIIAMTADAFADDVQKCKDAGMNGHVAKPVDPSVLFGALVDVMG